MKTQLELIRHGLLMADIEEALRECARAVLSLKPTPVAGRTSSPFR